jgi:hypothetical protein
MSPHSPSPSRIAGVGAWCFSHRRMVFAAWLFALIAVTALGRIAGNQFTDNLNGGHTQPSRPVRCSNSSFRRMPVTWRRWSSARRAV